ncbi:MAG TPA: porin [Anaeromyxobacter sp.]|nr:porin [Anaeromyxobacter sp.]
MNKLTIAVVALSVASAARAQEAQQDPQGQEQQTAEVAALEGRLAALEEQLAEAKGSLVSLSRLKFSGYVQARWAYQDCIGNRQPTCSYDAYYESPSSAPSSGPSQTGFHIRRARLKGVYDADLAQFVLQLDASPSSVTAKEAYASVKLPRGLAIDAGLQLLPFGYDVGVRSSADLDLLERFRGARTWLAGEYDLGVTVRGAYGPFNLRAGVFNGNGVEGGKNWDNDQHKDVVGRLGFDFGMVTGGVSGWYGKTTDYRANPDVTKDRKRLGADAQLFLDLLPFGGTALKGEFIVGTTTLASGSGAGGDLGVTGHAWHATLTQNLGRMFVLAARYESYIRDNNLVAAARTVKELRQLDVALHLFVGGNYKLTALYTHPMDGETIGPGTGDPAGTVEGTDVYTIQAQAKF